MKFCLNKTSAYCF